MTSSSPAATGLRVLVVEDDYFIASDMCRAFQKAGVEVAGPVPTVREALSRIEGTDGLDAAVLDINLAGDGLAFPIADALRARGVPFVFATGYDGSVIPERFADVKRFEKPCNASRVLQALLASR